jgi:hypothetical protein
MMDWRAVTALVIAFAVWFTVIVFLGASGTVHKSPELLAATMIVPLIAFMLAGIFSTSLKQAETSVPMEALILFSALRILCGTYLIDSGSGIDSSWAVPAAISGILLGLAAIPIGLFAVPISDGWKWFAVFIWNLLGFVDAVVSPVAAIIMAMVSRGSMLSIMQMPMFLLTAFILPVVLWTHFRISSRLWRQQTA